MDSTDNATFARTIKLLVANLDKTKERIQERFLQVDERIDELESTVTSIYQNLSPKEDKSTKELEEKIEQLTNKVDYLERAILELKDRPMAGSQPSPPVAEKMASTPNSSPPSSMPKPGGIPSPPGAFKPSPAPLPTSSGAPPTPPGTASSAPVPNMTSSTSAPSPASMVPKTTPSGTPPSTPASSTPAAPAPTAAKRAAVSIKDNKSEKDQLLEALKQLEGI